jgi:hypothetical protein
VPVLVGLVDDLHSKFLVLKLIVVGELVGGLAIRDLVITKESEHLLGLARHVLLDVGNV